jgi:hypothetical protein
MASRIIARFYHLAKGSTPLTALPAAWQSGVDAALKTIEQSDPKFVQAEIKGGPHKSTYEPEAGEDIVSVRLRTEKGSRIATAHIRKGGTYTKR